MIRFPDIEALAQQEWELRQARQDAKADKIRDDIRYLSYKILKLLKTIP